MVNKLEQGTHSFHLGKKFKSFQIISIYTDKYLNFGQNAIWLENFYFSNFSTIFFTLLNSLLFTHITSLALSSLLSKCNVTLFCLFCLFFFFFFFSLFPLSLSLFLLFFLFYFIFISQSFSITSLST